MMYNLAEKHYDFCNMGKNKKKKIKPLDLEVVVMLVCSWVLPTIPLYFVLFETSYI